MQTNHIWSNSLLPLGDLYSLYKDLGDNLLVYKDLMDYRTDAAYTTYRQIVDSVDVLISLGLVRFNNEQFFRDTRHGTAISFTDFCEKLRKEILASNSKLLAVALLSDDLTFDSTSSSYSIPFNCIPLQYNGLIFLLDELGVISYDKATGRVSLADKSLLTSIREMKSERDAPEQPFSITLSELKDNLVLKEQFGREAEQLALAYERKILTRHGIVLAPEIISDLDASRGYDIASYMVSESVAFDKFIEVKSCEDESYHFFISHNELKTAKEMQDQYFLYLYNRSGDEFYVIQNPYPSLVSGDSDWLSIPSVYSVRKIIG